MKFLLSFLMVFWVVSALPVTAQYLDSEQGDLQALKELYISTNGDNWHNTQNGDKPWDMDATSLPGNTEWWGVTTKVIEGERRVVHIDLQRGSHSMPRQGSDPSISGDRLGNNLVGELPEAIGNLRKLKYFNVKQNLLTGEIPIGIGQWVDVERILLTGHTREPEPGASNHPVGGGAISGKASYATNIFTGSLPTEVENLVKLKVFESQQNGYDRDQNPRRFTEGLSGQIPHVWSDELEMLIINSNEFTGVMPKLANSKKIQNLHIHGNEIDGEIPSEWGGMTNLRHLRISGNNLTGTIPTSFENLKDLSFFMIQSNNLSGGFPTFLFSNGNNSNINTFLIDRNNFEGELPDEPFMYELRFNSGVFNVGDNNFSGPLPDWLSRISPQQYVMRNNNFSGVLPPGFHDSSSPMYRNMRYIQLQGNNLEGPLPGSVFKSPDFAGRVTSSSGNSVSVNIDLGVTHSGTVTDAESRRIRDRNSLILEEWDGVTETRIIVPGGDDIVFTSIIYGDGQYINSPSSVNTSGTEGYRYEVRTLLNGKSIVFESEQGDVINRIIDGVSGNSILLDQPIDQDISFYNFSIHSESDNLLRIIFSNNQFSGPIPEEWAGIRTTRRSFDILVDGNQLYGEIPEEIARIPNLSTLNVSNNRFNENDLQSILNIIDPSIDFQYSGQDPIESSGGNNRDEENEKPDKPRLEFPKDEATGLSLEETLQWSSNGADFYRLQVRNGDSSEAIIDAEIESNPYYLKEWADEGATYRWRVQAVKDGLESEWSQEWSFTTATLQNTAGFPNSPELYGPEHRGEEVSLTPEFSWSDTGADYYILHVSRNSPSGMVLDVTVSDTAYIPSEILGQNSTHHWRVRGVKDGELGEWSDIRSFTTRDANLPEMADIVTPKNRTENMGLSFTFEWEQMDADYYRFRLRGKESHDWIIQESTQQNNYRPDDLFNEDTAYIWQIKSVKNGIEGAWGPIWEFSTGEYEVVVEAPELISPGNQLEYENLRPEFEWADVNADKYVIAIYKAENVSSKNLSGNMGGDADKVAETDVPGYTPEEPLEAETVYKWRVKAIKDGVEGEWSELWEFKTPVGNNVAIDPDERAAVTELHQNYPNPFNPTTQIEFTLSEVQNVSLRVYDMAGREVARLADEVRQAGIHTVTFNAANLASGVYFYRFVSESHQFTRKMTLVK